MVEPAPRAAIESVSRSIPQSAAPRFRACKALQELARATGRLREDYWTGKVIALEGFWNPATTRQLFGFDSLELDVRGLAGAFAAYHKVPMQTPYLDWVFLDDYLYQVYFACRQVIP